MVNDRRITNYNEYVLERSADDFVNAITALAKRTSEFGHEGVLSYRFFVERSDNLAAALIDYADGQAWLEHHQMAYEWPEMAELQATVKLRRLTFFGPRDKSVHATISAAGLSIPVVWYDDLAAGFHR